MGLEDYKTSSLNIKVDGKSPSLYCPAAIVWGAAPPGDGEGCSSPW